MVEKIKPPLKEIVLTDGRKITVKDNQKVMKGSDMQARGLELWKIRKDKENLEAKGAKIVTD